MRYFIVTYVRRANGSTDEQVQVARRLRPRDTDTGSVILDFATRAVLKSSVGDQLAPRDFQRIRDFYHEHYADIIDQLERDRGEKTNYIS